MIVLVNLSCAFNDYTLVMINLRPCNYENCAYVPEFIGHVAFPKNMLYFRFQPAGTSDPKTVMGPSIDPQILNPPNP